jgi:hypothetical protein
MVHPNSSNNFQVITESIIAATAITQGTAIRNGFTPNKLAMKKNQDY